MSRTPLRIFLFATALLAASPDAFGQGQKDPRDPRLQALATQARDAARRGDACEAARTARTGAARAVTEDDAAIFREIDAAATAKCQFHLHVRAAPPCEERETRIWLRPAGTPRGVHVAGELQRAGCEGSFDVAAVEAAKYRVEIEADGMRLEFRNVGVVDRGEETITLGPLTPLDQRSSEGPPPASPPLFWRTAGTGLLVLGGCLAVAGAVAAGFAASGSRAALPPTILFNVGALGAGLGGLYLTLSAPPPPTPALRSPVVGLSLGYQF